MESRMECGQITMNLNELCERITIRSLHAYFLTRSTNVCRCTRTYCVYGAVDERNEGTKLAGEKESNEGET